MRPRSNWPGFRLRVVVAAVFVLVCFGLLAARFHHLQVKRHDYFLTRAEDNRIALLPVVPHRGTIVDRKGVVLALLRHLCARDHPLAGARPRRHARRLASLLPIDGHDAAVSASSTRRPQLRAMPLRSRHRRGGRTRVSQRYCCRRRL